MVETQLIIPKLNVQIDEPSRNVPRTFKGKNEKNRDPAKFKLVNGRDTTS